MTPNKCYILRRMTLGRFSDSFLSSADILLYMHTQVNMQPYQNEYVPSADTLNSTLSLIVRNYLSSLVLEAYIQVLSQDSVGFRSLQRQTV